MKERQESAALSERSAALVGAAVGACAIGACAIGVLAIRRLAARHVVIDNAEIARLTIGDLTVTRTRIDPEHASVVRPGIVDRPSPLTVDAAVDKLKAVLKAKKITLFSVVDHSGEAAKAGLAMRPTKLLIFGSPKAGTPVMLATRTAAIDLPLKILVWEDADGKAWMSYNDPEYLKDRHGIPDALLEPLKAVEGLVAQVS